LLARHVRAGALPRLDLASSCVDRSFDLGLVELRTPVAMTHLEPVASALPVPDMERRTQRGAVIAGGGLDVHVGERRFGADLSVGDAVHGAAAGQAQSRIADARMQCPQNPERSLFVHTLQ
jgi:hypothetical protein